MKVEEEPRGDGCPDRAKPPSQTGTAALWQVKKFQKAAKLELYTPFAVFVRLVKEITESCSSEVTRWAPEALLHLQDAADFYLAENFDVGMQLTIREKPASSISASASTSAATKARKKKKAGAKAKPKMEKKLKEVQKDSPSQGTRSKKVDQSSPEMATRSKRRLIFVSTSSPASQATEEAPEPRCGMRSRQPNTRMRGNEWV